MLIFALSKKYPTEERYSLTDQVRRASRSVASNTAEAWRKWRCPAAFVAKLSVAETVAAETQTWVEIGAAAATSSHKLQTTSTGAAKKFSASS